MILLLDIGNSRVKWTTLEVEGIGAVEAATHRGADLDVLWQTLWGNVAAPQRVVAANVAGTELATSLALWCRQQWGVTVEFAAVEAHTAGIRNGYMEPARLGVDRWLAVIGAATLVDMPYCVVDCGTALTVDAVDAGGVHLGGWIVPGLGMMGSLLRTGTSAVQIDRVAGEVTYGFGHNTAAAVAGGAAHAAAGLVRQALELLGQQSGRAVACVVTGGDVPSLLPLLPTHCCHRPDLVLLGLGVWVRQEKTRAQG